MTIGGTNHSRQFNSGLTLEYHAGPAHIPSIQMVTGWQRDGKHVPRQHLPDRRE